MKSCLLEMKKIKKEFPGVVALSDVSFELYQGEILALCGENGAGKSTLMKILSGSYPSGSYQGTILLGGHPARFENIRQAQRAGIEMVYQEISLLLDATVAENIFLGNLPHNRAGIIDQKKLNEQAKMALDLLGLDLKPQEKVRSLSTGQQQMLSILRAYYRNPKILVLDEPTSALTEGETKRLMEMLRLLKEKGISSIYISHKLEEIFQIADRICVLRDGTVVSSHRTEEVTKDQLIEEMVGRKIETLFSKRPAKIGRECLRVEDLSVPHPLLPGRSLLENVSFTLHEGEILGLAGLVGAGRTELLEGIFGAGRTREGERIYLAGREVKLKTPAEAKEQGMGMVTEDRKRTGLVGTMDIKENATLASFGRISCRGVIRGRREKQLGADYFHKLRIKAPSIATSVLQLSGGNQQKVVLAKWLMRDLKILLLDEPTRGIDIGAKAEIYKIINDLAREGVAVLMASSEMPELLGMCDRILVVGNGKIQEEFLRCDFDQEKIMRAAMRK